MSLEITREFLGWCSIINIALLFWWLFFITLAHDWTYALHSRFFQLTSTQFDTIHYAGMGLFKLCVIIFNVVPYLALCIIT